MDNGVGQIKVRMRPFELVGPRVSEDMRRGSENLSLEASGEVTTTVSQVECSEQSSQYVGSLDLILELFQKKKPQW